MRAAVVVSVVTVENRFEFHLNSDTLLHVSIILSISHATQYFKHIGIAFWGPNPNIAAGNDRQYESMKDGWIRFLFCFKCLEMTIDEANLKASSSSDAFPHHPHLQLKNPPHPFLQNATRKKDGNEDQMIILPS